MKKADVDLEVLIDCMEKGMTETETAEVLGTSQSTIARRIGLIQKEQGVLMRYRALQSLQLTSLQAKVLEAITPEKIADAPLRDLILAFKVLKDNELTLEGKPKEFKGLVGYLIQLEKEEANLVKQGEDLMVDCEFTELEEIPTDEYVPNL